MSYLIEGLLHMNLRLAQDQTPIETPGLNRSSAIATASTGATELMVVRQRQAPGGANPSHLHDREEIMFVLSGTVAISAGDRSVKLSAGDSVAIPAGTEHSLANAGENDAEWLLIAPAGIRFFHQNGEEAHPTWAL